MSKNCYLIISPDPSENRELKIFGKAYSKTESSKVKPEDAVEIHPDQLHFVKFGDEVSTEDRVKDYRTHNPTFWWRTIELEDATGVDEKLGKYLEHKWLEDLVRPYGHAEWRATKVGQAHLEALCNALNDITNFNDNWWTARFKNKKAIDDFFNPYFG